MNGRGSNHPPGVVDLGALARPQNRDEHLAGVITLAQANPELYTNVRDSADIEEAFTLGHSRALAEFVSLTTGGMVNVPEQALLEIAQYAWVDIRGMMWVSAMATQHDPIEPGQTEFDVDLVAAYMVASEASALANRAMIVLRDRVAGALARVTEDQQMKSRIMRGL